MQVRQIAGMRGLVANPRGDMIPRPIKSNFREGLAMLEYFIATPGARKGLVDTALRTADSGYLTRRLVDVAQELIIREDDCTREGDPVRGVWIEDIAPDQAGKRTYLETKLFGRSLADRREAGRRHGHRGRHRDRATSTSSAIRDDSTDHPGPGAARRSPATPTSASAPSATAVSLATGKTIELGEAVGVIAAQSIGEPGTQLTMRTFHTGGIAGSDIAGGLPRVVELFEARSPKGKATLARTSGVVRVARRRGQGPGDHRRRRRRRRGHLHGAQPRPPRGGGRPGDQRRRRAGRGPPRPEGAARDQGPARDADATWSSRSRGCTATRACRSTTSTSS